MTQRINTSFAVGKLHSSLKVNFNQKRAIIMGENKLKDLSADFAVDIINLIKELKSKYSFVRIGIS